MGEIESGVFGILRNILEQKVNFENISHNIANINTNAFKKALIYYSFEPSKSKSVIDLSQGPIFKTGNPLDVAIEGRGFFKIKTQRGIRCTRDGAFLINREGILVTKRGDIVLGQNGEINVQGQRVEIKDDGTVVVDGEIRGKIAVIDFERQDKIIKEGFNYYRYSGDEREIVNSKEFNLRQGYLEGSNVSPTEEMVKLIETLRTFESLENSLHIIDDMNRKLINDPILIQ